MTITRDDLLHIARLAEIAVDEADLPTLVEQMGRIVGYVAQLDRAPAEGEVVFFVPGPARTPLREDVVRPDPLALPAADLAPEWREGYFVVPKLGAMEEP